ncbi:hypothetical protein E4T43_07458 [Aureobasidium subglaciale]|nr:hypothetical protein E4T43_07458 [Aureobasidium subglaciale]
MLTIISHHIIGGITPNVVNVSSTLNKGPFAGISAAGFLGLGNAYPDFGAYVQSSLIPEKAAAFNQAGRQCFYADVKTYVRDSFGEHFTQAATSTGDVLNFLADRFNGVAISGCSIRSEFLDALDPGAPGRLGVSLTQVLLNALGVPVGPNHF